MFQLERLQRFQSEIDLETLYQQVDLARKANLSGEHWDSILKEISRLPAIKKEIIEADTVRIGREGELSAEHQKSLLGIVQKLIPWRKGPFHLFGSCIDAEWRSFEKWRRIQPFLNLRGKRVADVGSSNGYYLFRALGLTPEIIVGFEPNPVFLSQFLLVERFVNSSEKILTLPLGVEEIGLFPEFFDVTLAMGILYHRRDPLGSLKQLFDSLRSDGQVFVETLALDSDDDLCLCPADRYSKMRNVFFIPSRAVLVKWLEKVGFRNVKVLFGDWTTTEEQRKTSLAPFESLSDFLDPLDSTRTIEGYQAPFRVCVSGVKP